MLKLQEEQTSIRTVLLLIAVAYIFSISMRFIWVNEVTPVTQFHWNNELMINNNDGYSFAEGARDIIHGHHEKNDLSAVDSAASKVTAFLSKIKSSTVYLQYRQKFQYYLLDLFLIL